MTTLEGYVRTRAGEPLSGVLVSNGWAVRRTAADGAFELDADGSGFVFVTRPTGFVAAAWFRRIDEGTAAYDFVLEPVDQPVPFTFAQITDLHLCAEEEPDRVEILDGPYGFAASGAEVRRPISTTGDLATLLAEIAAVPTPDGRSVAFVAATGDLTDRGVPAEYVALRKVLKTAPVQVEVLPGNHDHYGHRYEPLPGDRPVDSFGMNTGTTTRYEEHVGLRWWSMDHGGVHFAAIDWFSHRLGEDRDMQEEWLHADLAAQPDGTPVVLLVHDQMKRDFFDSLRRAAPNVRLLGSFSGHWHTCRTVMDGEEMVHANTGNATFGSCDFTPPQYRLCSWDGANLRVRTQTRSGLISLPEAGTRATDHQPASLPCEGWATRLPGAAHMARPVVVNAPGRDGPNKVVFAAWGNEEDPEGGLLALDAATGDELWRAGVASTVRAGAAYAAPREEGPSGIVVFTSVSGEVLALDASSGEKLWRRQVGDPLHMWVYQEPLIYGGLVFVGDVVSFCALDLSTGEVAWERTDLGRPENYVSVAHPVVQAGVLLLGFMDQSPNTWGLDPCTGKERWSGVDEPLISPMAAFLPDPDGEHAYAIRFGGLVEKLSALTGERRWEARVDTMYTAARPSLTLDATGLLATSGVGTVYRLDAATGDLVWRTKLPDEALLPMGPYRKRGPVVVSGPTVTGRGVLQGTCGGTIYWIDPISGEAVAVVRLDAPVAAPLAPVGEDVIAVSTDGMARRINLSAQTV